MPMMRCDLPPEVFAAIAMSPQLSHADRTAVAQVCRAAREATACEHFWRQLLACQMQPILDAFFQGRLPGPPPHVTWRVHYVYMHHSWKHLASARTGRKLVQVGKQKKSGRAPHELTSFWSLFDELLVGTPLPATFGVYDVTEFERHHPGIELHDAAELADATEWFETAGHSDAALLKLATLAVPGLQELPYDRSLPRLDGSDARRPSMCRRIALEIAPIGAAALIAWLLVWGGTHADESLHAVLAPLLVTVYLVVQLAHKTCADLFATTSTVLQANPLAPVDAKTQGGHAEPQEEETVGQRHRHEGGDS